MKNTKSNQIRDKFRTLGIVSFKDSLQAKHLRIVLKTKRESFGVISLPILLFEWATSVKDRISGSDIKRAFDKTFSLIVQSVYLYTFFSQALNYLQLGSIWLLLLIISHWSTSSGLFFHRYFLLEDNWRGTLIWLPNQ